MTEITTPQTKLHQQALLQLLSQFDTACSQIGVKYTLFAGTMLGAVRHKGFIPWDDDLDVLMLREDYEKFLENAEKIIDSERFFLQKEFSQHWPMFFSKLRMNNTTCLEKFHPKDKKQHQGIYIDIFPCDSLYENRVMAKLQFLCSKIVIAKCLDKRGYDTDSTKKKIFMCLCRLLPLKPFWQFAKGKNKDSKKAHTFFAAASRYEKSILDRNLLTDTVMMDFEQGKYPVSRGYDDILTTLYGDYMQLPPQEERKVKQHAILVDLNNSYEKYENYRDNMTFDVYTRSIR